MAKVRSDQWVDLLRRYSDLPPDSLFNLNGQKLNSITIRRATLFSTNLFTPTPAMSETQRGNLCIATLMTKKESLSKSLWTR